MSLTDAFGVFAILNIQVISDPGTLVTKQATFLFPLGRREFLEEDDCIVDV